MAKVEDLGREHLALPPCRPWLNSSQSSPVIRDENPTYNKETRETDPDWPNVRDDQTSLDASLYTPAEMFYFRDFMKIVLHLPDDLVEERAKEICNGNDEPLKGILVARLPRLRALTFVQ